jgi:pentose-5-phosphate-3-epimerase
MKASNHRHNLTDEARALLDEAGHADMPIQADGNCSYGNILKMEAAGASIFIAGSSSILFGQVRH